MKKSTFLILSLVIFLGVGGGVYFAWMKSKEILNPPSGEETGSLPRAGERTPGTLAVSGTTEEGGLSFGSVTAEPVWDYWLMPNGSSSSRLFYMSENGKIVELKDGDSEVLSANEITGLKTLEASPDGTMIAVASGGAADSVLGLFDVRSKVWQMISRASAGAFSPDGKSLVYWEKGSSPERHSLIIRDAQGAKPQTKTALSLNVYDTNILWIGTTTILLVPKPSAFYDGEAWLYDTKAATLTRMAQGKGLMVEWDPAAKKGLVGTIINGAIDLRVFDSQGKILGKFDTAALPSKCSFAGSFIYCAIPAALGSRAILPDDYLQGSFFGADFLYQFDTSANDVRGLALPSDRQFDISKIKVSPTRLFFVNRLDSKLYGLMLP